MKILFLFITVFAILIINSSCSKKEYTEAGINEICSGIDTLLNSAAGENFDWGSGEAYSYFTGYFVDSRLIFINEKFNFRSGGDSFNWYYVYENNTVRYVEKRLEYLKDENNKTQKQLTDLTVQITPSGDVLNYDKIVNGKREQLTNEESKRIFEHSRELIDIVLKRSVILSSGK